MHNKDMEEDFIKRHLYVFINTLAMRTNQLEAAAALSLYNKPVNKDLFDYRFIALKKLIREPYFHSAVVCLRFSLPIFTTKVC